MDNDLKEALTEVLKAELSPVIEKFEGVYSHFDAIVTRLEYIDSRLGGIDSRLNGIESRLGRLELEQSQIKQAVLETNETVKRMELIQDQQHRIIELLSARSIEQEAKLKRIG